MTGNDFNLAELYQNYFGLQGFVKDSDTPFAGATALPVPVEVASSIYGVAIYEQITLTAIDASGNVLVDYTFPGWPLISVGLGSKIIKTDVVNLPGSVKEFIAEADSDITIRGLLINHDARAYPLDLRQAMVNVKKANVTLKVTCDLLNNDGIHFLVIEHIDFPEVEGNISIQPYTITAVSDFPYDLVINDPAKDKATTKQQLAIKQLLNS